MLEAFSDGGSTRREGRANVVLVFFKKVYENYFEPPKIKITYVRVIFYELKRKARIPHKNWVLKPQRSAVLFCLLANEARIKLGDCRALVVKG